MSDNNGKTHCYQQQSLAVHAKTYPVFRKYHSVKSKFKQSTLKNFNEKNAKLPYILYRLTKPVNDKSYIITHSVKENLVPELT